MAASLDDVTSITELNMGKMHSWWSCYAKFPFTALQAQNPNGYAGGSQFGGLDCES